MGTLHIDHTTFTVYYDSKDCKLGDTDQFHLIDYLSKRSGTYVSHEELDKAVVKTARLKGIASDVRKELKKSGILDKDIKIDGTSIRRRYALLVNGPSEPCDPEASKLAESYVHEGQPKTVVSELLRRCIDLHQNRNPAESRTFAQHFESHVEGIQGRFTERHQPIIGLLKDGLPINPVHLPNDFYKSMLTYEYLVEHPPYASLLHGIRLTEIDYAQALALLDRASREYTEWFSVCALIQYAMAQAVRKIARNENDYNLALSKYTEAAQRIGGKQEKGTQCRCGAGCLAADLRVEIHRGAATVLRRKKEWDKAETEFKEGLQYINHGRVSKGVQSSFFYSFGYFHFERAFIEQWWSTGRKVNDKNYRSRLEQAKKFFITSMQLKGDWCAPVSRLAMVKQLLDDSTSLNDFLTAINRASGESGVEARLTEVNAKFAVLLHDSGPQLTFDSKSLFDELLEVFLGDAIVARGPRECHAFDNAVVLHPQESTEDQALSHVHGLLQAAAKWEYDTLAAQHRHINEYLEKHGLNRSNTR